MLRLRKACTGAQPTITSFADRLEGLQHSLLEPCDSPNLEMPVLAQSLLWGSSRLGWHVEILGVLDAATDCILQHFDTLRTSNEPHRPGSPETALALL